MANQKKTQTATVEAATIPAISVRIDRMLEGDSKTKAFASATIGGAFAIHGIRIIESDKGRFVAMPQEAYTKNGEKQYSDTFHPITKEARTAMYDKIEEAYQNELNQQQGRKQDKSENEMEPDPEPEPGMGMSL